MLHNYEHSFTINGRQIFVPTAASRTFGVKLQRRILGRWTPPDHYFQFKPGGHVAAARAHLGNHLFVRLDLKRFYDSVTRSKIHRALRFCAFSQRYAWESACQSTVSKGAGEPYSLPFGFVQSPILASLALAHSAVGAALADARASGLSVSVYVDDILLSAASAPALAHARTTLEAAALASRFEFHPGKSIGPSSALEVFNLELSHDSLSVCASRLADFEAAIRSGDPASVAGILGYVSTVNEAQRDSLAAV